jgi:hypothetical protein
MYTMSTEPLMLKRPKHEVLEHFLEKKNMNAASTPLVGRAQDSTLENASVDSQSTELYQYYENSFMIFRNPRFH